MSCPAEILYKALMDGAKEVRTRRGLAIIHELCVKEREQARPRLTVEHIGGLSVKQKPRGPSAKTIFNRAHDYRALVRKHAEVVRRPEAPANDQDWLREFGDPEQRAFVQSIVAERNAMRLQVRALQNLAHGHPVAVLDAPRSVPEPVVTAPVVSEAERLECERAVAPERLKELGWSIDELGRAVSAQRLVMLSAGLVTLLRKLGEPPSK